MLSDWFVAHAAEVSFAFVVCSSLLNMLLRFKSAGEWIRFCEEHPNSAAFIRFVRAVGIDPVKAIEAIQFALNERALRKPVKK